MTTSISNAFASYQNGLRSPFEIIDTASNIEGNLQFLSELEKAGCLNTIQIQSGTFNTNNASLVIFNPFTPTFTSSYVVGYAYSISIGWARFQDALYFTSDQYLQLDKDFLYNATHERLTNWLNIVLVGSTKLTLTYDQFINNESVMSRLVQKDTGYNINIIDCPAASVNTLLSWSPIENNDFHPVGGLTIHDSADNVTINLENLKAKSASYIGMITLNDTFAPQITISAESMVKNLDALLLVRGYLDLNLTSIFDPALVTNSSTLSAIEYLTHPSIMQGITVRGTDSTGGVIDGSELFDNILGGIGQDIIRGWGGNDFLLGDSGSDSIYGGAGFDILSGGAGNDILDGGEGINTIYLEDSNSGVMVDLLAGILQGLGTSGIEENGTDLISNFNRVLTGIGDDIIIGLNQSCYLNGGSGDDQITGGTAVDYVVGGDGNDTVIAGDGNDIVMTGDGNDIVNAGAGNDLIIGGDGAGDDTYNGGDGVDTVKYTSATAAITVDISITTGTATSTAGGDAAGIGNDTLTGIENIIAGNFNDTVIGGSESNAITGENGNDSIDGGAGNDTAIYEGTKSQYVITNNNNSTWTIKDTVSYRDGTDMLSNIEYLQFTDQTVTLTVAPPQRLTLTGTSSANILTGGSLNDILIGLGGVDVLNGTEGSDLYVMTSTSDHTAAEINDTGTSGTDEVRFKTTSASTLTLFAGDRGIETVVIGTDTAASAVTTGTTANNINASAVTNALSITGNNGNNSLTGTAFNDTVTGNSGNDILNGGVGADTLIGGIGNDTYVIDNISDLVTENTNEGIDLIQSFISYALGNHFENLTLIGTSSINGTGNAAANTITGNAGANSLTGGLGNDTLNGGAGNDRLIGGAGNDVLFGGKGQDSLTGGAGSDTFTFAAGDDGITAATLDKVLDYAKGAVGTGDLIDYSAILTKGGNANTATASQASINQSTGIATFASGSGTTLADALNDITARFTAATDTTGEFAFFRVNNTGDNYLFVSDGTAGAGVNDDVIQLVGVTSIETIDLTGGNLTITS